MATQAWYIENGKPCLIFDDNNIPENITNIKPPEGIYQPFYFDVDNQEWIGSEAPTGNGNEGNVPSEPPVEDSDNDSDLEFTMANLMFENSIMKFTMEETQKEVAELTYLVSQLVTKNEENEGEKNDTEISNI